MKILAYLTHPADYHMLKNVMRTLIERGHRVMVYAREKDVLIRLLEKDDFKFYSIRSSERNNSIIHAGLWIVEKDIKMYHYNIKFKPDILIGNCINITHMGRIFKKPSVLIRDDDNIKELLFGNLMSLPFASAILTPQSTNMKNYSHKQIKYNGFKELAYLHPNWFTPDSNLLRGKIDLSIPYSIIRFAKLTAYHDLGKSGISFDVTLRLIDLLSKFGNIYISSEDKIHPKLKKYKINIDPALMHHAIYFANIYIGDSQTMAAEAAVLGTPSIRFNDFIGKLGYLNELEFKYGLTYGVKASKPEVLIDMVSKLMVNSNIKKIHQERRIKMLDEKIDVASFMVWFIENYPNSKEMVKKNPKLQNRFV